MGYAFRGQGQLSTNISGLPTITYGADFQGRTSTVNAGSGQNPVSSTLYNVASQVTDVTLGSGDSDHFTYDPNTGRMTQYKFTIGSTPQNVIGNLTWNPNGSMGPLAITDPFNSANSQTCNYTHDDLSRITSTNCGSAWNQTFWFDSFGNITKTGSSAFNPTYYTSSNQIATLPGAPAPTYDAFGRMVKLNNSGAYTETLYGLGGEKLALLNGTTLTKAFVALPAGTAVYAVSGLAYYRHSEWLGSARFASTPSQTIYSSSAYAPFGEQYAKAGTNDPSFTGQQQDTAAGLYDFLFRRLSQTEGRWISPDPLGVGAVSIASPQSWNRYAYVQNNPMNSVDPFGLLVTDPDGVLGNLHGGGGGGGLTCMIDGLTANCGSVLPFVSLGLDIVCPNASCNGFSPDGTYYRNTNQGDQRGYERLLKTTQRASSDDGTVFFASVSFKWVFYPGSPQPFGTFGLSLDAAGSLGTSSGAIVSGGGVPPNNGYSKRQNLSVLDPNYEYKKLLYSYCKDSAEQRVGTSIRNGAMLGAATGALFGGVSGELFGGEVSLGTTGVAGAYVGAHIGGVMGAIRGLETGLLNAGGCAILGAY